jgi:hypothetical protein
VRRDVQASAPQRISQTAAGAVAAGAPHRSGTASRPWQGGGQCLAGVRRDPTRRWAVLGAPAHAGPLGAEQAETNSGSSPGWTSGLSPLGQLDRAHWANRAASIGPLFGPITLSAQYRPTNRGIADVMLTSATFLIKILSFFKSNFRNDL